MLFPLALALSLSSTLALQQELMCGRPSLRMLGSHVRTLSGVKSQSECVMWCLLEGRCLSLNYDRVKVTCELLAHAGDCALADPSPDHVFYSPKLCPSTLKVGSKNATDPCEWGPFGAAVGDAFSDAAVSSGNGGSMTGIRVYHTNNNINGLMGTYGGVTGAVRGNNLNQNWGETLHSTNKWKKVQVWYSATSVTGLQFATDQASFQLLGSSSDSTAVLDLSPTARSIKYISGYVTGSDVTQLSFRLQGGSDSC